MEELILIKMIYSKNEIDNLSRDFTDCGVVLLKGFCKNNRLNLVKSAIEFAEKNPSPFGKKIKNEKGEFFYDFWTYKRNLAIKQLLSDPDLINTVKSLVKTKELKFFHDHILVKQPSAPSTPWHQDRPYYFIDGPKTFSIWITPDEILEENSLAFCNKSHKGGNEYVPVDFKSFTNIGNHQSLKFLDNDAIQQETSKGIIVFRMQPGDAILFNNRTLHKSLPSSEDRKRSALSLRFVGDNTKITTICSNPTPPFHKLGMKMIEGAPLEDKWFPNLPF